MTDTKKILQDDLLQYKKNKLPANLALLGLLFNALYFCILYSITTTFQADQQPSLYVNITIGISVLLTLVTLLTTFLSSEGIKAYKKNYCIALLVLAAIQLIRISYYPVYTLEHQEFYRTYFWIRTGNSTILGVMMIVWLCASAGCLLASAVTGYLSCKKLENHIAAINSGAINMDDVFAEDKRIMEGAQEAVSNSSGQASLSTAEEVE